MKKIKLLNHILAFVLLIIAFISLGWTEVSSLSLKAPVHLSTEVTKNYIELHWENADNNAKYTIIEKSRDQGGFSRITSLSKGTTSYKDRSISNGHVYTYRFRTVNGSVTSPYSQEIEAVTLYPESLTITNSYYNQVDLEWEYPSFSIARMTGYKTVVERRLRNDRSWTLLSTLPSSETSYRDTSVAPDSIYYYRIRTRYSNESYSNNVPSDRGISTRTGYPLTTPLTGYAISDTSIRLEWDMTQLDNGKAVLQKKDADGEFFTLYTTGSREYYVDSWLTEGETYTYRLMMESDHNTESEFTDEIKIAVESVPTPYDLSTSALSSDGIILSWTYPYDSETDFEIWRKSSDNWHLLTSLAKNTEHFTDSSVTSGQTYCYKVRARRGESAFSSFSQSNTIKNSYPKAPDKLVCYTSGGRLYIYSAKNVPSGTTYTLEIRKGLNSEWLELESCTSGSLTTAISYTNTSEYHLRLRANIGSLASYSPVFYFYGSVPDPAQSFKASNVGADRVILTWKDIGAKEDGYLIYRTYDGRKALIGQTEADTEFFIDKSPISGTAVKYELLAFNPVGQSSSTAISVTVLPIPVFKDITNYSWAHKAIDTLWGLGALDSQNGYFYPQHTVTRGQMAQLMLKSFGIPCDAQGLFTLTDLPLNHSCYQHLMTAVKLGLLHPDFDGKIYPDKSITRGELLHMINNTLSFLGIPLNPHSTENLQKYADYYDIAAVDASVTASFTGDGIITGKAGKLLSLSDKASKAETVVILYRALVVYR